jgi:hypothetical protein
MNQEFIDGIEAALAVDRISAYRQDEADDITALARYSLNVSLCEALYSPLQFAEVALRNSIHNVLRLREGTDEWYNSSPFLLQWQKEQINEAREKLQRNGKGITPGRMVAELSFGFWTAFFNKAYGRNGVGHLIAARAFPHAPQSEKSLKGLDRRWNDVRILRNRVFHHERIIHWKDLSERHQAIIEMITWIQPKLGRLVSEIDRFQEIYKAGFNPWRERICAIASVGDR